MKLLTITLLTVVSWANAQSDYPDWINGTFPDDFAWGLATASYQVEGSWDADGKYLKHSKISYDCILISLNCIRRTMKGKGENIWDHFAHATPSPIIDGSTGDIACDSYKKYQVDVQLLRNMGVRFR